MRKSPLAKKITILIVAVSTVITIGTTGYQLFDDYQKGLEDLNSKIDTLETMQVSSLSHSMWTFDVKGIQISIDNFLKISDIEYIEVAMDQKHRWSGGELVSRGKVDRVTPIYYYNGPDRLEIGSLRIVASVDKVYDRLVDKAIIILASNGFKTFFVSIFILFLFNRFVTRHLTELSQYATKVAAGIFDEPFHLNRKSREVSQYDELDHAVSAINYMRRNLITEVIKLKNTEKELTRTRVSVEIVSDAVFWLDSDATIIDVNKAACSSLGYTRDELLALKVSDIDPNYNAETWKGHFQEIRQKGTVLIESAHRPKKGQEFPVEIVANYILHDGQELNCAIVRNIYERKKAEAEKRRLASELQQAQKMEAIGILAGGIAHDFNNILGVILGYAEIVKEDVSHTMSSSMKVYLDEITTASLRAKELVQQILAFSRQSDSECSFMQPGPIVREAVKILRPTLPTTIAIHTDIMDIENYIWANQTQLHQIMMNLCTNAYHAMESTGGDLTVTLKEVEMIEEECLQEYEVKPGVFVELTVSDTGTGMDRELQSKVFDPYFTTKETGKGTGMGLSIVHGIVKSYGGGLSLTSQPGKGTSVKILLPATDNVVEQKEAVSEVTKGGEEKILLIDDEDMLVNMGKEMLERIGYKVTGTTSSTNALKMFRETPELFDVVITDQTMPGLTGDELAARMLDIRPEIPIILCTGYSSMINEERAKRLGIKAFVLKPLAKQEIASVLRQVLDR